MPQIVPFLMFEGCADEAMEFYTTTFKNAEVLSITRYGKNAVGTEGSVQLGSFLLNGQEFMCIDSNVKHAFSFTPSLSLYVKCTSEEEIEELFTKLSAEGNVLMPLSHYFFSKKYGWVSDKFGVTWQLNLPSD